MEDSTTRFSRTVENYLRYRPAYPKELIEFLKTDLGMNKTTILIDAGAGTGKLTQLLLEEVNHLHAVEPNQDMMAAAQSLLKEQKNISYHPVKAEDTKLPDQIADLLLAAQTFHWLDHRAFARECRRILKPNGKIGLIWNDRLDQASGFMRDYDNFLRNFSKDYAQVDHRWIDTKKIAEIINYQEAVFDYHQTFDLRGLIGRYQSASYALTENDHYFREAIERLTSIFNAHQENGAVKMLYQTRLFYGQLKR